MIYIYKKFGEYKHIRKMTKNILKKRNIKKAECGFMKLKI